VDGMTLQVRAITAGRRSRSERDGWINPPPVCSKVVNAAAQRLAAFSACEAGRALILTLFAILCASGLCLCLSPRPRLSLRVLRDKKGLAFTAEEAQASCAENGQMGKMLPPLPPLRALA
jgi:hypothetical protein